MGSIPQPTSAASATIRPIRPTDDLDPAPQPPEPPTLLRFRHMRDALDVLLPAGGVYEVRTLDDRGRPGHSGYFDDRNALARKAGEVARLPYLSGVYATLNPVKPELLARANNRLRQSPGATTTDVDILRRTALLIDLDPVRPAGIPSTDAEHDAARRKGDAIAGWLAERGWPEPARIDSGNGEYLIYRVDLPNDAASDALVRGVLEALAREFDDPAGAPLAVKVDTTVHNASRLVRLPGTMNRKGDGTDDRPHRWAKLREAPPALEPVPRELLAALATTADPALANPGHQPPPAGPVTADAAASGDRLERWVADTLTPWAEATGRELRGPDPWRGGGERWTINPCPWNPDHTDRSAYAGRLANGARFAGCHHHGCARKGWHDLRDAVEPGRREGRRERPEDAAAGRGGPSVATRIVELVAAAGADLWHTPEGVSYATFAVADHLETHPLRLGGFRRWAERLYYAETGRAAGSQAMQDALGVLEGRALYDGPERRVSLRVAGHDDKLYLDLANPDWEVVEIGGGGWRIIPAEECPVKFRRTRGMLPLPTPTRGGDLAELRGLLNLGDDDDWTLIGGWLLAAFRPTGPYPILALHGEQGSAKSTTARALRGLVDPSTAALRSPSRDLRDFAVAANNTWTLAYDNLSGVPAWLSDALCCLSTGGGAAFREHYSNDEETILTAQRPVILTGIEEVTTRSDLLDRTIIRQLPPIPDERRRTEEDFRRAYEAARPRILGALLDAVAGALRELPGVALDRLPRMADFAMWVVAAERSGGLGWERGRFLRAYEGNRAAANALALEGDPVARAVARLVGGRPGRWTGTPSELLHRLNEMGDLDAQGRNWPRDARALSGRIKRLAPNLRAVGVDVEFGRQPNRRYIALARREPPATGAPRPPHDAGHDAHDAA